MSEGTQQRGYFGVRPVAAAEAGEPGQFEVLAITAGTGNGWRFSAEVLQRSLAVWDGVECFVDHSHNPEQNPGRSLRDLGGVFHQPEWDAAARGIRLRLRTLGPAGGLVRALGQEMLSESSAPGAPAGGPRVGFSADIGFTAKGKEISEIVRVYSVDLVYQPARGGAFVRHLPHAAVETQLQRSEKDGDEMMEPKTIPTETGAEPTRSDDLAAQLSSYLLETTLAASRLPQPVQDSLRKQFGGQAFAPEALARAVDEGRALVSALSGAGAVQGPRISGMADPRDQLQAAVDDLFGAPRERAQESLRVARLSGVRELYMTLTGDYDLHGGYYPERARLASTADFTGLVKNAMNKVVVNRWRELGRAGYDWWERVVSVEHFDSVNQVTGTLIGTVGSLPQVEEGGAYPELAVGDSPEVADFVKYGGYIPLTLELIDRDETRKLRAYPRELASAGLRNLSSMVAAIFTDNSHTGPQLADGSPLFNTTAAENAGGHANLRTGALSAAEWDAACTAVYNQPMLVRNAAGLYGSGPRMAINPRFLMVPRALQLAAMKILYPTLENAANIYSENQQRGQPGDVLTVPEWTDATNWAAVCDPRVAPAIFVGERFGIMPEVFIAGDEHSPAVFTNDEHRLKVRHFLTVWVNDYRPLHKNNVAG
jgi:hypothetical protein